MACHYLKLKKQNFITHFITLIITVVIFFERAVFSILSHHESCLQFQTGIWQLQLALKNILITWMLTPSVRRCTRWLLSGWLVRKHRVMPLTCWMTASWALFVTSDFISTLCPDAWNYKQFQAQENHICFFSEFK